MRLMDIYGPRGRTIGNENLEEVKILAGPEPALMLNDRSPGRTWRAEIGQKKVLRIGLGSTL